MPFVSMKVWEESSKSQKRTSLHTIKLSDVTDFRLFYEVLKLSSLWVSEVCRSLTHPVDTYILWFVIAFGALFLGAVFTSDCQTLIAGRNVFYRMWEGTEENHFHPQNSWILVWDLTGCLQNTGFRGCLYTNLLSDFL